LPYFLDSNVIIGYIFYNADNWGNAATYVFEDPEPNHSGYTVQQECFGEDQKSGRVNTIKFQISKSIRKINFFIKNGKSFEQAISEINEDRLGEIIKDISKISTDNPQEPFEEIMRKCNLKFQNEVDLRINNVNNKCEWHYCNLPYREIYSNLTNIIDDNDDIEVLINAHHVSQSVINLVFISGDYKHIIPNIENILKVTQISDIKPLGDFR